MFNSNLIQINNDLPLQQFIFNRDTLSSIEREVSSYHPTNYGWTVAWLTATSPFRIIFSISLHSMSCLLSSVGARNLSIQAKLLARHFDIDINTVINYFTYGGALLVPVCNAHQLSPDIYLLPDIPDPANQDDEDDHISFFSPDGACIGESLWFASLWQRLISVLPSEKLSRRDKLVALAEQFYSGAPLQASIIQALPNRYHEKILRFTHNSRKPVTVPYKEANRTRSELEDATLRSINLIPTGLHAMKIYFGKGRKHYGLLIKESDSEYYIFDPNTGLLHYEGDDAAVNVSRYLGRYLFHVDHHTPPAYVFKFETLNFQT